VKVAPGGRFEADNDIVPANPGFDALTVKTSREPIAAFSGPGTVRRAGTIEAINTLNVFWTRTVIPDPSATVSLTV
jgi:hypothetical protein